MNNAHIEIETVWPHEMKTQTHKLNNTDDDCLRLARQKDEIILKSFM